MFICMLTGLLFLSLFQTLKYSQADLQRRIDEAIAKAVDEITAQVRLDDDREISHVVEKMIIAAPLLR